MEIINFVKDQLDIQCKTLFSSDLEITSDGSDRILDICNKLNTKYYISGTVWLFFLQNFSITSSSD